jgi:hypothetical protein
MLAVTEAVQADPARSQQARLLAAWAAEIGTGNARETTVTARQLEQWYQPVGALPAVAAVADRQENLYEVLKSLAGTPGGGINTRSLGKLLSKFKDRVYGGYRLRAGPQRQGATTWWVEELGANGEFGEFRESVSTASRKKFKTKTSTGTSGNKLTKLTTLTAGMAAQKRRGTGGSAAARTSGIEGLRGSLRGSKS